MIDKATLDIMLQKAKRARDNAYAPYSKFKVGACARAEDGTLFGGANVENASYGLTTCAEVAAISSLISAGHKRVTALLIVGQSELVISPCGRCRQFIREFVNSDTPIYLCDNERIRQTTNIETLLPDSFGPNYLAEKEK